MTADRRVPRSSLSFPRFARTDATMGTRFWPTLLLVALCQVADLLTFNLAVEIHGPQGELGPLGLVYRAGGFFAVAAVKLGLIAVVLTILARYPWQRVTTRRNLAVIVAVIGLFGAFTNVWAYTSMPQV